MFFLSLRHQARSPEALERYLNLQPDLSQAIDGPGLYCKACKAFGVRLAAGGAPPEARAFLETMRKVWSRAELSPALLREPGAAAASPQARIVQEIESRDY